MRYLLTSSVTLFLAAPMPADIANSRWMNELAGSAVGGAPAHEASEMDAAMPTKKILDILKKPMNLLAKQFAEQVQLNYSCTSRTRHGVA